MSERNTVWLRPPWGEGEPKEFDPRPDVLVPLLVAGWSQCEPPASREEVKEDVHG